MFIGRTDAKAETPILWPPNAKVDSFEKTLMLGKIEGRRRRGTTEVEMVGWHHRLDGHGFGWTPGVGDGQGGLVCCSSWDCKESDTITFVIFKRRNYSYQTFVTNNLQANEPSVASCNIENEKC